MTADEVTAVSHAGSSCYMSHENRLSRILAHSSAMVPMFLESFLQSMVSVSGDGVKSRVAPDLTRARFLRRESATPMTVRQEPGQYKYLRRPPISKNSADRIFSTAKISKVWTK